VLGLVLLATAWTIAATQPLHVRIELDELAMSKGALVVRAIVSRAENQHKDISVLTWDSPLDDAFGARNFVIKRGKKQRKEILLVVIAHVWVF